MLPWKSLKHFLGPSLLDRFTYLSKPFIKPSIQLLVKHQAPISSHEHACVFSKPKHHM